MEFCRTDGYCISVDFKSERLVFTYTDFDQDLPKEKNLILDHKASMQLFEILSVDRRFSKANIFQSILDNFKDVKSLEEIKNFLNKYKIIYIMS